MLVNGREGGILSTQAYLCLFDTALLVDFVLVLVIPVQPAPGHVRVKRRHYRHVLTSSTDREAKLNDGN